MTRKFESSELIIATHNAGKVREIAALLGPYISEFTAAGDLGLPEPEENGASFAENAKIKALAASKASGKPALADDSGLSVAALGGAPGIFSARWAGSEKDFKKAMAMVQDMIAEFEDRRAAFICALCIAWPDGESQVFEGQIDGHLTFPARGEKGFGYDPIFIPEGQILTFAEMAPEQKQAFSHRARAFAKLTKACF